MNIVWTPDSINTRQSWYTRWSAKCTAVADTAYRHCDFNPGVSYRGVAYSYGGKDNHTAFRGKIPRGLVVGSHSCHYTSLIAAGLSPVDSVGGTDCSAFVCYMWNVPRTNTTGLARISTGIRKSELRPGDILVDSSVYQHTVLIADAVDPTHFLIWEASPSYHGCRERTIDITTTPWSDASFLAQRNSAIAAAVNSSTVRNARSGFFCITVLQGGKAVSLDFAGPFGGTLEIRSVKGETIFRKNIMAVPGTMTCALEKPFASGMYILSLRDKSGLCGSSVAFTVFK